MEVTVAQLKSISGAGKFAAATTANMQSVVRSLKDYGKAAGLDKRHRLAHFLAQLLHESGGFFYDREVWGPTAAQKRYETGTAKAKELGNTEKGDGKKFAGRGPIQLTGRGNVTAFEEWCRTSGYDPPDFSGKPDLINTDPWEGLSAIWFWTVGNQTKKSLNPYADENGIEMITRLINGGLNGFDDRIHFYTRTALVLLGYGPTEVEKFQTDAQSKGFLPKDTKDKKQVDGIAGPQTRSALHLMLVDASPKHEIADIAVKAAPVVSEVAVDVQAPLRGVADAVTGGGVGSTGLGVTLHELQDSLTPFSTSSRWIEMLVVILIVGGGVLTIGGLAWRWYSSRKKTQTIAAMNAPLGTVTP